MATQILRWQFTVADYARMLEAGILHEDDRVELIDGEVRAMAPVGPGHAGTVKKLTALLSNLIGETAILGVQDPIRLNDYSEPQPDLEVLRYREDFYTNAHPEPADVLLIVEVAESSLAYDREEKVPRYAQARIPEVWLFHVEGKSITQYTRPEDGRYGSVQTVGRGQVLVSEAVSGLQVPVDDIFG